MSKIVDKVVDKALNKFTYGVLGSDGILSDVI